MRKEPDPLALRASPALPILGRASSIQRPDSRSHLSHFTEWEGAARPFLSAGAALAGLGLLFSACHQPGGSFGPANPTHALDTVTVSNGSEPKSIDPGLADEQCGIEIVQNCFEGLTAFNPKSPLKPIPGIAESWDILDGGRKYVFHLRKAVWTDGQPVVAGDFVYAWTRALSPVLASQYAYQLWYLKGGKPFSDGTTTDAATIGAKAIDDRTLEVTLEQPTPYFLFLTGFPTYMPVPKRTIDKWGDQWTQPEHIVSNGAYRLVRWAIQDELVVEKSPTFWDAEHVKMRRVVALTDENNHSVENLYRSGEVDTTSPSITPPIAEVPQLRKFSDYSEHPYLATYWYWFNARKPPFNDVRVRRAFAMAVDKKRLLETVIHGVHTPAWSVVPELFGDISGYRSPLGPNDVFDASKARELLAAAGFPGGKGFPVTSLMFNPDDEHRIIAEALQAMWHDALGVQVDILNVEWKVMLAKAHEGDFDMIREGWTADYPEPSTFLTVFLSEGGQNDSGWKNDEYDSTVKKALGESDPVVRNQLYSKAERILLDDLPVLPIYVYTKNMLAAPRLGGLDSNPLDIHLYRYFFWK